MSIQIPGSKIRVAVSEQGYAFAADLVQVYMGIKHSEADHSVMRIDAEGRFTLERIEGFVITNPSFAIPRDFAIALMNSLLQHFQGAEDTHTLRSDLLHERGRVDKLTNAVIDLAEKLADQ